MPFFMKKHVKEAKINSPSIHITKDISENIVRIKNEFGYNSDLKVNYFTFDTSSKLTCATIYITSLVDKTSINNLSAQLAHLKCECHNTKHDMNFERLRGHFSGIWDTKEGCDYDTLFSELLFGSIILLIDGCRKFFSITIPTDEGRQIDEPTSQTIIRGPKDGFTENLNSNILLIRKRIRSKNLKVEKMSIGSLSKTTVTLMFMESMSNNDIVQEIRNRLGKIEIDCILDSGYIEELIKDDKYTLFPTFLSSERPDSVVGALMEGKVAIMVDGTPYVLTAPALMFDFFQASEDYYHNFIVSSLLRVLRFIAFFLTLLVPSAYVAITTFHQEILPTSLLVSIAAQREGVPFPALVEALIMEFTFEILREAGIRMPRAIGPAISIVGALVLGQAAVDAGIISAVMVIIVSITAISSFAIPNYEMANAVRAIRFLLVILSGILGLYGILMGLIILTLHLCKIKSISVPYLTHIAPKITGGNKDTILRFPLWSLKHRPIETRALGPVNTGKNRHLNSTAKIKHKSR